MVLVWLLHSGSAGVHHDGLGGFVLLVVTPVGLEQDGVHLSGVDAVLNETSDGRLWFAGPIKSCQRDPMADSVWLIEFDSSRVIACDRSQPLVFPMLSEEEQADAAAALAESAKSENRDDDANQESNDE